MPVPKSDISSSDFPLFSCSNINNRRFFPDDAWKLVRVGNGNTDHLMLPLQIQSLITLARKEVVIGSDMFREARNYCRLLWAYLIIATKNTPPIILPSVEST